MNITPRLLELLAQPVNPLSAQELHDEEFVKMKRRTPAQARQDKTLVEELLRQKGHTVKQPQPPTFQPRSKADWLRMQFYPDNPTFPLDPEVVVACPKDLPGELPTNATDLYAEVDLSPGEEDLDLDDL